MKKIYLRSCFVLFLMAAPLAARATPILYSITGTASGTLGGTAFTNAAVTITETADSTGVSGGSGFLTNQTGISLLTIAGLGTARFTSGTFGITEYQGYDELAFYDTNNGFAFGEVAAPFATYTLQSVLSPVVATLQDLGMQPESTSRGDLVLSSVNGNATFSASPAATPESGTLLLVSMGALGAGGVIRWQWLSSAKS